MSKTFRSNSFFKDIVDTKQVRFKCFKFLNIILHKSLETNVRRALVFEYSLSKSQIKQLLQSLYIRLIFLPGISELFSDKSIRLPSYLSNYAVVPGNHRIRLFESSLKTITVLLKNNEASKFIKNDIDARFNNNLSYAPKILSFGPDWLVEEFINGVPFNRVNSNDDSKEALNTLIILHTKELINTSKKKIKIKEYLNQKISEIYQLVDVLAEVSSVRKELIFGLEKLFDKALSLNISELETSTTHGDFQEGNVRINSNNELFVLDWESADDRFYLYDAFVMFSGVRTGINLEKAFESFFQNVAEYNMHIDQYSKTSLIIILCFEEARFNLNEDISENFLNPGLNSIKTLTRLLTYLNIDRNE